MSGSVPFTALSDARGEERSDLSSDPFTLSSSAIDDVTMLSDLVLCGPLPLRMLLILKLIILAGGSEMPLDADDVTTFDGRSVTGGDPLDDCLEPSELGGHGRSSLSRTVGDESARKLSDDIVESPSMRYFVLLKVYFRRKLNSLISVNTDDDSPLMEAVNLFSDKSRRLLYNY